MARRDRRHKPHQACLILAMATTTASAMSLANFQIIGSSAVPLSCILAYNSPIAACSTADFTSSRTCSAACARDLQRVESRLLAVCDGVAAPSASVLGQALLGRLVDLLCPAAAAAAPSSTTKTVQEPTAAVVDTSTTTTTSSSPSTTLSSSSTSSSLFQMQTVALPTTADDGAATAAGFQQTEPSPPPPVMPAAETQPTAPLAANSPTQRAAGAQQTRAPSPKSSQSAASDGSGGGSPFDIAAVSGAGRGALAVWWLTACALLFLMR
ncbi:hypothetical protein VTK73DRAFT_2355 [Phialemonium thermophilum]|uniref:Uncharacterized protein n=1 Tax=Phialemonium thermophilum TaxID=223376 RepID=A0ABR3VS77_9PEZI